jgi:hypothetical protein
VETATEILIHDLSQSQTVNWHGICNFNLRTMSGKCCSSSIQEYSAVTLYHHHHHHISVMELGHLLTRSGFTCLEALTCLKHTGSEAKVSNPTTGLTLLWARNPFRGNFNHWQVSQEEAGQIFFKRRHGCVTF